MIIHATQSMNNLIKMSTNCPSILHSSMNVIRDFLQHTELLSKGSHLDICTGFEGLDIISFEKARSQTPDILSSFIKIMIFTTGIQQAREKTEGQSNRMWRRIQRHFQMFCLRCSNLSTKTKETKPSLETYITKTPYTYRHIYNIRLPIRPNLDTPP